MSVDIGQPKSYYGQLVWTWTRMWQEGTVPKAEFDKLLSMQNGWWNRGLAKPNDDMIAQLESWIKLYQKQSNVAAPATVAAEEIF